MAQLEDTLPEEWLKRLGLRGFLEAIDTLHHPRPGADEEALSRRTLPAWRRMKFDELLAQQLSMRKHTVSARRAGLPCLRRRSKSRVVSPPR